MARSKSMSFSFSNAEMPIRFGRYMLLKRTTTDAIGEHFLALWGVDEGYDQLRIVRAIYPAVARDEEFVALFTEEARALSQLLSANVARVVEVGLESEIPFVAQEHVEGLTLDRVLEISRKKNFPCSWELAVHVVSEILRGLDYIHRREDVRGIPLSMRHGDVRPQNVLISFGGEVKLTNFNSALYYSLNEATNARFQTERGIYAPPEGADRNSGPAMADDLWGASVILLAMLDGPRALKALSDQSESDFLPSIAYSVESIPKRLNLFLARALHPDPDSRFESAFQMRDTLLEIIRNSAVGHPPDDLAEWCWSLGTQDREEEERLVRAMLGREAQLTLDESADVGRITPGVIIDSKYHLLRVLGEGGMGQVFEAEHLGIEKRVAVKVLHERVLTDHVAVERFKREAKIMGGLHHPNVVEVFDYGMTEGGNHFLAMELLDGVTLAARIINHGPVPPKTLVGIMIQVCDALEAAHQAGVIHRDLKPENIFLTPEGPRLVDFGIAKRADLEEAGHALTQTGNICGTVEYISPEQLKGHTVDQRLDVYAVGLIIYESLTGHTPFRGRNIAETMHRVMTDKVVPPRKRTGNYNIPVKLEKICLRAMARNPERRFQTAIELKEALESLALPEEEVAASVSSHHITPKRALYRNLSIGLMTAIITLVLGTMGILYLAPSKKGEATSVKLASAKAVSEKDGNAPKVTDVSTPPKEAQNDTTLTARAPNLTAPPSALTQEDNQPAEEQEEEPEQRKLDPEETKALVRTLIKAGEASIQRGEFQRGFDMLKRATDLDGTKSRAWFGLGQAAFEMGNQKKAITTIKRALMLNPGKHRWRIFLGKIYIASGNREKAIKEWQRVLKTTSMRSAKKESKRLLDAAGVDVSKID